VFLVATAIASTTPVPAELPAIALGQVAVYRVKILLALVYGGLLLLTPFFEGVLNGRMPIEISHRGAKWQEQSPLEQAKEKIASLEAELDTLKLKHFVGKGNDALG
jgi:hypothetical protein